MNEQEVIARFCKLASTVAVEKFDHCEAADCFCGFNPYKIGSFQFDEPVLRFIEDAVRTALDAKADNTKEGA